MTKSAITIAHINGCDELVRRLERSSVFDIGHINAIKSLINDMEKEVVEE